MSTRYALTGVAKSEISTFNEFVAPLDPDDFLRLIYAQKPAYIPGPPERYAALLSWGILNESLSRHPLENLPLVIKDGRRTVPKSDYTRFVTDEFQETWQQVDLKLLNEFLKQGVLLMLTNFQSMHHPVSELTQVIERALGACVGATVFASLHPAQNGELHWDVDDVFALQIDGTKHWRILEPARRHPTSADKKRKLSAPAEVYWEGDLRPGDLLYVPRGWWHVATPMGAPTLHLSLAVRPQKGLDFAQAIVSRLADHELMRANVPRHATPSERDDYMRQFRAVVSDVLAEFTLTEFLRQVDSNAPPGTPRWSLPWAASSNLDELPGVAWVSWCPPRQVSLEATESGIRLLASGSSFLFSRNSLPILTKLSEQRKLQLQDLWGSQDRQDVNKILQELLALGLVTLVI